MRSGSCTKTSYTSANSLEKWLKWLPPFLSHSTPSCKFRYDLSTGIYGMDFFAVLERPGYSVGRRHRCKSRVGIQHRVTKEDTMKWSQVKYEAVILNKSSSIA
ncbi:60S ribosomal protein L11-1 [Abeliophyllum distichum]|uniref:60S ribosomal protein L11-1 n=1 Tax=Abeliophyllum distichum TaxID=126358 RepID=A0ABD1QKA7_9LAMI